MKFLLTRSKFEPGIGWKGKVWKQTNPQGINPPIFHYTVFVHCTALCVFQNVSFLKLDLIFPRLLWGWRGVLVVGSGSVPVGPIIRELETVMFRGTSW